MLKSYEVILLTFCHFLPKPSGDVQGETGQSSASSSNSTCPYPPYKLSPLRLRLLARAGLRRLGNVRPFPAPPGRDSILRFCPHGSYHHKFQSHGAIGRVQPNRTTTERQSQRCRGDLFADVQDYRPHSLTEGGFTLR